MNKKTIFSWLGVIILGALGSALWEVVKPLLTVTGSAIVEVSTLGVTSLRDGLYSSAAATLGRPTGMQLVAQGLYGLIALSVAFTLIIVRDAYPARRGAVIYLLPQFLMVLGLGATGVTARSSYSLGLALHYEHLEVLAAPSLTDIEIKQYRAAFAQVRNRDQYVAVVSSLAKHIEAAGTKAPTRDLL